MEFLPISIHIEIISRAICRIFASPMDIQFISLSEGFMTYIHSTNAKTLRFTSD